MSETEALTADTAGLPDFRRMPVPDAIRWLAEHGEPADPRPDIDTASLARRFPHLAGVGTEDHTVDGPHGSVPIRVHRDAAAAPTGRVLVWVHGGAFIGGFLSRDSRTGAPPVSILLAHRCQLASESTRTRAAPMRSRGRMRRRSSPFRIRVDCHCPL